jgi:hypothetical protein
LDKDDLSTLLTQSAPGETVAIADENLRSIFAHGEQALDERARREVRQFAEEHDCNFLLDEASRQGRFTKRAHPMSPRATAV